MDNQIPRGKAEVSSYLSLNLIAFGLFWFLFSGLCSAFFAVGFGLLIPEVAIPSLLIGAASFAIGWWMGPRAR